MEKRALGVVLVTILVVALVAGVVFLKGNGANPQAQNTNSTKTNAPTTSTMPALGNESVVETVVVQSNVTDSAINNSSN